MSDDGWQRPVRADAAGEERERRRAEREARRRCARRARSPRRSRPSPRPPDADDAGDASADERLRPGSAPSGRATRARPRASRRRARRCVADIAGAGAVRRWSKVDRQRSAAATTPPVADGRPRSRTEDARSRSRGPRPRPDRRGREGGGARGRLREGDAKAPQGLRPRASTAPRTPPSLEGFLFPATYELKKADRRGPGRTPARRLRDQLRRVDLSYAKSKNLTVYDVVMIASMIEREVQVPEERELVAAVIYNRLAPGHRSGSTRRSATRTRTTTSR